MNQNRRRKRFNWIFVFLLLTNLCFFIPVDTSFAAKEKVQLQVDPGWKQEYNGEFVPVKVMVSGAKTDVNGELSVQLSNAKLSSQGPGLSLAIPTEKISLSAGTTKEVTLIVPYELARPDALVVFKVNNQIVASQKIGGRRLGTNDLTIGVLSDDPSVANIVNQMIASANQKYALHTYPLNVKQIPTQGRALSGLDVLVLHRLTSETLTPAQIQAIKQWVTSGGKLVVGGGNQATVTATGLEDLLPVQLSGQAISSTDLKALNQWSTPPTGKVELAVSKSKSGGTVLATNSDAVLIAKNEMHKGKVLFIGYDFTAPPLSSWSGHTKLWEQELLFKEIPGFQPGMLENMYGLEEASRNFPHLRLPSLIKLIMVYVIYLVVIGPILYWLFARMKKHEWNWFMVPLLGVMVAVGLYVYGNWTRGDAVLAHNVGYIEADTQGNAFLRGVSAIVSQEADDYEVGWSNAFAWPVSTYGPGENGKKQVSFQNGAHILFQNVPQWSKRTAYVEQTAQIGGSLVGEVSYKNQEWVGEIQNQTRLTFSNVHVLVGDRVVAIGAMKPGEKKPITIQKNINTTRQAMDPMQWGFEPNSREFQLLMNLMNEPGSFSKLENIDVIGWTQDQMIEMNIKDHRIDHANFYLVNGKLKMKPDAQGKLLIPHGAAESKIIQSSHPTHNFGNRVMMENAGTVVFEYSLDAPLAKVNRLDVNSTNQPTEIYNWQSNRWESVDSIKKKNPLLYISSEQKVQLRINIQTNQEVEYPTVEVEGSVQ